MCTFLARRDQPAVAHCRLYPVSRRDPHPDIGDIGLWIYSSQWCQCGLPVAGLLHLPLHAFESSLPRSHASRLTPLGLGVSGGPAEGSPAGWLRCARIERRWRVQGQHAPPPPPLLPPRLAAAARLGHGDDRFAKRSRDQADEANGNNPGGR